VFPSAVEVGFGQFVEQDVGLAVQDTVALLYHGLADSLSKVTLARATRTEKQRVLTLADEDGGSQVEDQAAVGLGIESKVEIVESLQRITESRLLSTPLQEPISATGQLVRDQARDQIDGRHWLSLGLAEPGLEHGGHTAEA